MISTGSRVVEQEVLYLGKLQHVGKVIRLGRTFLKRVFGVNKKQRFIRLNATFRSDLTWWHLFMATWNGVAMMVDRSKVPFILGCIRIIWLWGDKQWFQFAWPEGMRDKSITQKELLPIVWAACGLCFFGFLRSGEVVAPSAKQYDPASHLCFEDIMVDSHSNPSSFIQVKIKASKTDPYRQGVTVYIGRTGGPLCLVTAVLAYMVARGNLRHL